MNENSPEGGYRPAPDVDLQTKESPPKKGGKVAGVFNNIKSAAVGHAEAFVAKGKEFAAILPKFKRPSTKLSVSKLAELQKQLDGCLWSISPSLEQILTPKPSVLAECCQLFKTSQSSSLNQHVSGLNTLVQRLLELVQSRNSLLLQLQEQTEAILNSFQVSTHKWASDQLESALSQESIVKAYCLVRLMLERVSGAAKRSPALLQQLEQGNSGQSIIYQAELALIRVEDLILAPLNGFWKTRVGFVYQEYDTFKPAMRKVAAVVKASPDNLLDRITHLHSLGRQALVDQAVVEEKSSSLADDLLSLGCVMAHCFLATFNYYGYYAAFASIPQTNPNLVAYLSSAGYFQLIFAIGPVVDLAMQKYYEFLSKRNYATIYAHSVLFLVVGNLCYFFQKDLTGSNAMVLLMVSRAFMGAGLAKKASEKYLAVMINSKFRGILNVLCSLITRVGQMLGPSIAVWFVKQSDGKDVDYYPVLMTACVCVLGFSMIFLFKSQDEKIAMRERRNQAEADNCAEEMLEDAREGEYAKMPAGWKSKTPPNRDAEITISNGQDKDAQEVEQFMDEAITHFKKETEVYLRWSTWYLFATLFCSKLVMEMFFTERSMIANSWTSVGYTLSVSGFIYLILSFVNGSAVFTFNFLMKCCPARFFLPLGILTLLLGSVIKFPYDVSKSLSLLMYYIGTGWIIFGSALTDACVFRLLVSAKSAAGVGVVVATGFSELATALAKIVANSSSGIIGVLESAGTDKVPLYFYTFSAGSFGTLFVTYCCIRSKLANVTPQKEPKESKKDKKEKEKQLKAESAAKIKEKEIFRYVPMSVTADGYK